MDQSRIPEHVLRFITEQIDNVPQLEALLLLWESAAPAGWTCEELAARIYVSVPTCSELLAALERRGLVEAIGDAPMLYRYRGDWDENGERMSQLAAAYRTHLVEIATLIHTKNPAPLREFARAFELKGGR